MADERRRSCWCSAAKALVLSHVMIGNHFDDGLCDFCAGLGYFARLAQFRTKSPPAQV
jgi:hypothetical protein